MSVFDFHFHPIFKQAITQYDAQYPSLRSANELSGLMELTRWLPAKIDEYILHILESQACIEQLQQCGHVLGVAAICPIEQFFTDQKGLYRKLLNGKFTDPFDKTYNALIREGQVSYYQLFLKELDLYRILARAGVVNLITRNNKAGLDEKHGIHLCLSLEGGHGLVRSQIGKPGTADTPVPSIGSVDSAWQDMLDNPLLDPATALQNLQQSLWDDGLDLCYLTLTHLSHISEQHLATHAYGMKMINDTVAYPKGSGLTEAGKRIVETAYTLKVEVKKGARKEKKDAPVLIDVKHMSLRSRQDLYALRQSERSKGKKLPPLIATHMGVTGYSVQQWVDAMVGNTAHVKRAHDCVGFTIERCPAGEWGKFNKRFSYNAWTVNLMDDDIIEVLDSEGLIGVSLDVRILGWQGAFGKGDVTEYLSREDFRHFFPHQYARIYNKPLGVEAMDDGESWLKPTQEERHPLALCFNLLHIASVGMLAGHAQVWDHVCIGSDFDGLIDPVKICRDAGNFGELRRKLVQWLPTAEKAYRDEHGGPVLLPTKDADLHKLVDKIMIGNGRDFLKNKW